MTTSSFGLRALLSGGKNAIESGRIGANAAIVHGEEAGGRLGAHVGETEPGARVQGVPILDGVSSASGGNEGETAGTAANRRGLNLQETGRVERIRAGEVFLQIGLAVAVGVDGPVGGGGGLQSVEQFPIVGHAVAVHVHKAGRIGSTRGWGGGLPVERFVAVEECNFALERLAGAVGV